MHDIQNGVEGIGGGLGTGGGSPATRPLISGIPLKKKVWPKRAPNKFKLSSLKGRVAKSFGKFSSRGKKAI